MTRAKTTQQLIILAAMMSAGLTTNTVIARASEEMSKSPSRMEMIVKKLTPDNQSFAKGNSNLSTRFVSSQDGDTQVNVLINEKHSLDLSVLFEPGSAELTDKARTLLNDLATALRADRLSTARYLIGGHTDAKGGAETNRTLSKQRARNVKSYLVNNFEIDPARLATAGYGEDRLADKNNPEATINSRIEVSLISTGYSAPKRVAKTAKIASPRVQPTSARSTGIEEPRRSHMYPRATQFRSDYQYQAPYRPLPVEYRINRQFDDYNSDIYNPPTITGRYAIGMTYNTVCDSYEGVLTDPRPQHMHLDDYDARTPATCDTAVEYQGSYTAGYKDNGYGQFSPEDDIELLK